MGLDSLRDLDSSGMFEYNPNMAPLSNLGPSL